MAGIKAITHHIALWAGIALALFVFCFWNFRYPQALSFQEQNQLFLWTIDYLFDDLSAAGGLADWLSQFIVQFYYVTWLGAVLLALLFWAFQRASFLVVRGIVYGRHLADAAPRSAKSEILLAAVSLLPPLLMLYLMGDINVMLSFPVAVTLSLYAAWIVNGAALRHGNMALWADIVAVPLLFWLIGGGATWLYVALRIAFALRGGYGERLNHSLISLMALPYLFFVESVAANTLLRQWPRKSVYIGLNYYYAPMKYPGAEWGYNEPTYEMMMQDYLVRHERWADIISRAEKHQVKAAFSSNCVNLALSQLRQLDDRMFSFFQTGEDALLFKSRSDNMSNYPTMEAYWRLGMVNSCLRYATEIQSSILTRQKSGRITRRIVECHIVNGNYKAAQRHINLLKKSLFYRGWALEAEALLGNEELINSHPVYGRVRSDRFKDDFLFVYAEKPQVLRKLFLSNKSNKMALDYFLGELLLHGKHQAFKKYVTWAMVYGDSKEMPWGYQDALNYINSGKGTPGSPYAGYCGMMLKRKGGAK